MSESNDPLRPNRLSNVIGNDGLKERLLISIRAALERREPMPHLLFDGISGGGKTTISLCIANELGVDIQIGNGASIETAKDILPLLTKAEPYSVIFVDELHRMPIKVEEILYTALEDRRIDIPMGEGRTSRVVSIDLEPFTLIGATTIAGLLSEPLRNRFTLNETIDFYNVEDLSKIATINAEKLGVTVDDNATTEIAKRSRGTPRILNNQLKWCRDLCQSRKSKHITLPDVQEAFAMKEVDGIGLSKTDRRYMDVIYKVYENKPVGIDAIASTMNTKRTTIEETIEPYLLRLEFLARTNRGRQLLPKGIAHIQQFI